MSNVKIDDLINMEHLEIDAQDADTFAVSLVLAELEQEGEISKELTQKIIDTASRYSATLLRGATVLTKKDDGGILAIHAKSRS